MKGTGEQDISPEEKSWRESNIKIKNSALGFLYSLSHFYFIFNLLFNFPFLESRVRVGWWSIKMLQVMKQEKDIEGSRRIMSYNMHNVCWP